MPPCSPTIAEIHLNHLTHNIKRLKEHSKAPKLMGVVKANAYGHGMLPVAQHLASLGVDYLGVAVLEEGITLRKAGIKTPILVFGGVLSSQIPHFIQWNLEFTIASLQQLRWIEDVTTGTSSIARIHLKIDTGMERIGVSRSHTLPLIDAILKSSCCEMTGIYSHLACSDDPESHMTLNQLEQFQEVLQVLKAKDIPMPLRHLANSGGVLHFPETHFDMIRPGIIMYGAYPSPLAHKVLDVKALMTLKSQVVFNKTVPAYHPVSYGATWESKHPVRIATVPVGYGDGYRRALSSKGKVLIHGKEYPVVGRVCMDQIMINLEADTVHNGEEVILIGSQDKAQISADQMSEWVGTISYEILTGIAERVPRVYLS